MSLVINLNSFSPLSCDVLCANLFGFNCVPYKIIIIIVIKTLKIKRFIVCLRSRSTIICDLIRAKPNELDIDLNFSGIDRYSENSSSVDFELPSPISTVLIPNQSIGANLDKSGISNISD